MDEKKKNLENIDIGVTKKPTRIAEKFGIGRYKNILKEVPDVEIKVAADPIEEVEEAWKKHWREAGTTKQKNKNFSPTSPNQVDITKDLQEVHKRQMFLENKHHDHLDALTRDHTAKYLEQKTLKAQILKGALTKNPRNLNEGRNIPSSMESYYNQLDSDKSHMAMTQKALDPLAGLTSEEKLRVEFDSFKATVQKTFNNLNINLPEETNVAIAPNSMIGTGSGEVRLQAMDDVDDTERAHGTVLAFNSITNKYEASDPDLNAGIALEDDSGDELLYDATSAAGSDAGSTILQEDATRIALFSLQADSIKTVNIVTNAVTTNKIAAAAVTATEIADTTITADKMAANSINSDQYVDASIDTVHIGDLQITAAKVANATITAAKVANATITTTQIAADTVAESNMADDAIGSVQLKTLSTLLIKNSGGTVLKTVHGAGA